MIIVQDGTVYGTGSPDIIVSGANDGLAVYGSGGSDIMLDNFGEILISGGGASIPDAVDLDASNAYWYDDSLRDNPLVSDDSIPNMTVALQGAAGENAWFAIHIPPGETLTVDVDAAFGALGTEGSFDSVVAIYGADGGLIAFNDDTADPASDVGSETLVTGAPRDSMLVYTNAGAAGVTVYIKVGEFAGGAGDLSGPFAQDVDCLLNISLSGHAVTATPPIGSGAYLDGGFGDDVISGGAGNDDVFTSTGNDRVYVGAGDDRVTRGDGAGRLFGDAGVDRVNYGAVSAGVTVDLLAGTATGATVNDVLSSFEDAFGSAHADTLSGTDAGNYLYGNSGTDSLFGRGGDDILDGEYGDDALYGESGNDYIIGGEGNDLIVGGTGLDRLFGGNGDDRFEAADGAGTDHIDGGEGYDVAILASDAGDGLIVNLRSGTMVNQLGAYALSSIEHFVDCDGGSRIVSAATCAFDGVSYRAQVIDAAGGNDVVTVSNIAAGLVHVDGGSGDDIVQVRDSVIGDGDRFDGGADTDLVSFSGLDLARGGLVSDIVIDLQAGTLSASTGVDALRGFENATGSKGGERILGTSGANTLNGLGGDDTLEGRDGDDRLLGGRGDDQLTGGAGNDILDGGVGGFDLLVGGIGNDVYIVHDGFDLVYEIAGQGVDEVRSHISFSLAPNLENLTLIGTDGLSGTGNTLANVLRGTLGGDTLAGLGGNDILAGNAGDDSLIGGDGDDTLNGGEGVDALVGGGGGDILRGESGDDNLRGGDGNDRLYGGAGRDRLDGDGGSDVFYFDEGDTSAARGMADIVAGFSHADGDRINLAAIDANSGVEGDQHFTFIGEGAFTGVAGQLRAVPVDGRTYVEGDSNGDGVADFAIQVTSAETLVNADFVL